MWKLEFILCLLCPLAVVFAIPCSIEDMQAVCHEHWKGDYVTWDCRSASTFNVLDCNIPSRIKIHHLIFREGILHTTAAVPFAWVSSIQKLSLLYIQNEISLATILYLFPMVEELNVTGTTVSLTNRVSNTVRLKELSGLVINASVPSLSELGLHTLESLQVKVMDPEEFHAGFLNDLALIKLDFTSEYHESFNWSVISNRAFALKQLKLKFKSLREFPIRCPFHALVVLSITVAEARFVRETLFMTTSSIPLPYLRALKLSGFWLPQPTSFVGFNLEILEISNSKGNIANLRHYPAHLKMLRISYCKMDTIQYRAFGILRQLITLDLAFNGIRYIDQDAFQTYPAIQTLLLNNNKLNSLFLSQGDLRQLRILDVSYNQLVVMSIHWLNRTTLAHLRARHNQITRFAENIQSEVISGSSFKVLDLRENPLVCSCDLGILLHLLPSDSKKLGYCRYNTTAANYRISRFYVQDCKLAQFNASEDYEMQSDQSHDSVRLIATTAEDKLRESLSILKSMTTAPEKPSVLKANYGTSFTQFAHVYTGVEMFLVHINLLFPNFTLPYFEWDDESFVALCKDQDSLVQTICADFTPLVRRAVQRIDHYSKTLRWKLSQIHDLYGLSFMGGKNSNVARSRRTRSLPNDALERLKLFPEKANDSSLLKTGLSKFEVTIDDSDWQDEEDDIFWKSAFLAPLGATKMARTYAKRHQIFKDTIGHLASRQILIKEAFIDLRGDLLTAVNVIADSFNATSANIYTLHELLNKTNYQIVDAFKALGHAVNVIQRKTHAIRILSVLTTKYLQR